VCCFDRFFCFGYFFSLLVLSATRVGSRSLALGWMFVLLSWGFGVDQWLFS